MNEPQPPSVSATTKNQQSLPMGIFPCLQQNNNNPSHRNNVNNNNKNSNISSINNLIIMLIFFIIINIILIIWIIISLNLYQNSSTFIRTINMKTISSKSNKPNNNNDGRFRIDGNLIGGGGGDGFNENCTVYTNEIQTQIASHNDNDDDDNQLQIQFQPIDEINPSGDVQIKSNGLNPNSLHLSSITGNLEFKINNRLMISSEKPRRLFQIENDCLIIEDSSTSMAYIRQQPGGLRLSQMITDSIVGSVHDDLRIESRTEQLSIETKNSTINIESNMGRIELKSYDDININTEKLSLNGRNILFVNLNQHDHKQQQQHNRHRHHHQTNLKDGNDNDEPIAYQLCMCTNGELFAADESIPCQADHKICGSHDE
ncbi:hypothetical protein DERP_006055 [Dermatophagoides pteronyssinus]|uniref:Uncharacterized protein n=1 Tax=Dermatophagoides pteronyssinus TaxID=6956 RepID=A0ABQ8JSC5_DERPT|nr:hypothetical protein DERP_006055 [Dermatophagoides pteronyssinus]